MFICCALVMSWRDSVGMLSFDLTSYFGFFNRVVALDEIKGHFPNGTTFEDYWPAKGSIEPVNHTQRISAGNWTQKPASSVPNASNAGSHHQQQHTPAQQPTHYITTGSTPAASHSTLQGGSGHHQSQTSSHHARAAREHHALQQQQQAHQRQAAQERAAASAQQSAALSAQEQALRQVRQVTILWV